MANLLESTSLALRHNLNWISYRSGEERLQHGKMSFHDTLDAAMGRVKEHQNASQVYNVLPVLPLFRKLRWQLWLEKFWVVRAKTLQINPEKMIAKYLRNHSLDREKMAYGKSELVRELLDEKWTERFKEKLREAIIAADNKIDNTGVVQAETLPADLKNNTIMGTSHILTDELFTKAIAEIQKGNEYIVYDNSRQLLESGGMYFLKDEAAAKTFKEVYAPSGENVTMFRAASLMDIYDHFQVGQIIKTHHVPEIKPSSDGVITPSHIISQDLINEAATAIQHGQQYAAYNLTNYFLEKGDVHFFKSRDEAEEFSMNNISEYDNFHVIKSSTIKDFCEHFRSEEKEILSLLNNYNFMNDKNVEDLEKKLLYTGFGEHLNEPLKAKIQAGEKEFVLSHVVKYGKDEVVAALQFRKSDTTDMYFFNRYNMMLKNDQYPDPISRTFFINRNQDNVTLKEGYNLLSGRAVQKELHSKDGEKYNAWIQLDFKESDTNGNYKTRSFNDNYGFKLEEVLSRHPLKELQSPDEKQKLIESLQRGNRQMVTLEAEGKDIKIFIEAAPQYKSLNYYNADMKRMQAHELQAATRQTNSPEKKQEDMKAKQSANGDDDLENPKKKRVRRPVIK